MNVNLVAISKVDGGYLISSNDSVAVRKTFEESVVVIKKWTDKPPLSLKARISDLFGLKPDDKPVHNNWVTEEIEKDS